MVPLRAARPAAAAAVRLDAASVRYRLPRESVPSLKEYAVRWLRGHLRFDDLWALRDVTLEVKQGESFGIIGHNGAGKSTLLKLIARVLRPTSGRVRVWGRVAPLLELGAGFDYELTGRENVYLNGTVLGHSRANIAQRFDRIVDFAGVRDFIDLPLRTWSTGMVARLGFAVATDVDPDILIIDEVLAVGDAEFQTRSKERMQSLFRQGQTILMVSHNLATIAEACQRVAWLDHGCLRAVGPADDVVRQYREAVG
jgi:ABC-type polysaccharide/polyol phosphate transport system ATPase subunit